MSNRHLGRVASDKEALDSLLRTDFRAFARWAFPLVNPGQDYLPNWHMDAVAYHLQLAYERQIKRLIINLPPRHGKSFLASVAFPAWGLGKDPALGFICVSYAQPLANKLARDTRRLFEAPAYRALFPTLNWDPHRTADAEMVTTLNGSRYASSIGGSLTGYGGNFIVVDDPMKADGAMSEADRRSVNNAFDGTISNRLTNPNDDVIILVHQRLHEDDLSGHVQENGDWVVLALPALAPEPKVYLTGPGETYHRGEGEVLHPDRLSREVLDGQRQTMGTNAFSAQYQQVPMPEGGLLIDRAWIRFYDPNEVSEDWDEIVQSWDTASKVSTTADYSVGMTFGIQNRTAYLLDVTRGRWEYPVLRQRVIDYRMRREADRVLVEDANSGLQLGQDLRRTGPFRPFLMRPKGDKVTRVETHSAKIEAGDLRFPRQAPWMDELMRELLRFPNAPHDDQIDALTQFLEYFGRLQRNWRIADDLAQRPPRRPRGRRSTWFHRVGFIDNMGIRRF